VRTILGAKSARRADLSFADTFQDQAIMIISKPESHVPQVIELRREAFDQASLFGEAIDARGPNHINAEFAGHRDGVVVIQEQALGLEFERQGERFALSRMQPSLAESRSLGFFAQRRS
jgi:hypothetical protein